MMSSTEVRSRRARLLRDYERGQTLATIASREGISTPRVHQLLVLARGEREASRAMTPTKVLALAMEEAHDAEGILAVIRRMGFDIVKA